MGSGSLSGAGELARTEGVGVIGQIMETDSCPLRCRFRFFVTVLPFKHRLNWLDTNSMDALKKIILSLLCLASLGVVTVQAWVKTSPMPHGAGLPLLLQSLALVFTGLVLCSLIYLIPKTNRNIKSFLKAFATIGVLASLGGCHGWIQKFHGPPQQLTSEHGLVIDAPSDWSLIPPPNGEDHLFAVNWSQSVGLGIYLVPLDAGPGPDSTPSEVLADGIGGVKGAKLLETFECGVGCAGQFISLDTSGGPARMAVLAKNLGDRWIHANGYLLEKNVRAELDLLVEALKSIRYDPALGGSEDR